MIKMVLENGMEVEKIDVLDKGYVSLINMMPYPYNDENITPDRSIVNCARVSFLGESKGNVQDKKLLMYLMKNKHTSPFEMVEFQFKIHAPVLVWWQLVRHRTANLNLQSGRYTPFEENDFYVPEIDAWRMQATDNKQGSSDEVLDIGAQRLILDNLGYVGYENISELLQAFSDSSYKVYDSLLKAGVAKEQARLFLPAFALYYEGIWKIDAHNLMNFLKLRLDSHAQYEIRVYAQAIYEYFSYFMPWTKEAFEIYVRNN